MTYRFAALLAVVVVLALGTGSAAFAEEFETPPAVAAMPDDAPAPVPVDEMPPPPAGEVIPITPIRPAEGKPLYPTGQPGSETPPRPYPSDVVIPCPPVPRPCPPPPCEMPTVRDFGRTVTAVQQKGCCPAPCPVPCDPCCPPVKDPCAPCAPANNCFWGYGGVNIQAWPGLGFGAEFGGYLEGPRWATLSWEVGVTYQDMTDGFNGIEGGQSGKWNAARLGFKSSFFPKKWHHPVVRAGFGWAIATGDTNADLDFGEIKRPQGAGTNYFGLYVGVGYEFDFELFCNCFSTGPEFSYFYGWSDRGSDNYASVGTLMWHFIWNF